MNGWLILAGALSVLTAVVHSVMGERLIFRHLGDGGLVPSRAAAPLQLRHIRILWATWHLASVFGAAFAAVLFRLGGNPEQAASSGFVLMAIVIANLGGSLLVLVGTRGRHPGWIALLLTAVFTAIA